MRRNIKNWKVYGEPEENYSLILYKSFSFIEIVKQMLERLKSSEFRFHLYPMIFFTSDENMSDDELFHQARKYIESSNPKPLKNETITVTIVRHGFEVKQNDSTIA